MGKKKKKLSVEEKIPIDMEALQDEMMGAVLRVLMRHMAKKKEEVKEAKP